jgi:signal transduction histidine kinase
MVSVHIVDTGVGIAPEHLPHIFQPFYRVVSHVEGTGLGLSIARQIVSMHGGELTVASTPGRGSTFTLRLRRVDARHGLDAGSERQYLHDTPDDVMLRDEDTENISES